jgi:hypothetical protein
LLALDVLQSDFGELADMDMLKARRGINNKAKERCLSFAA